MLKEKSKVALNVVLQSSVLKELEWRGFIKQCTNLQGLDELCTKEEITLYSGYDLSADSLHVGNLMTLMMCRIFKKHGHNVIALLGGATTKISDPSGRDDIRKPLTDEQIAQNLTGIAKNFTQILGENIQVVNNYDWLAKKGYLEILGEVGSHFSINRMIKMDSVESRIKREQLMTFLEFNYMIFQGYDFYHLTQRKNCVLQVGGSDQWGNILQGVELNGRISKKETFGLTCPLIAKSDGTKMGKSINGAVWLAKEKLSHFEYFQYFRNLDDADVNKCLKFFTDLTESEIDAMPLSGREINETKKRLAFEATKVVHGGKLAQEAYDSAEQIYESGNLHTDMPEIKVSSFNILDVIVECGVANSRSEAKTLIAQSSIRINGEICSEITLEVQNGSTLQIGKKRFMKIIL